MNRTDKDLLEQEEHTMGTKTGENKKRTAGRIRNGLCTLLACAAFILAQSCTNVIHELIPPSDSGIHSFSVENADRTRYRAAETDGTEIVITVPAGTDATALIPIIESGSKSTVIPVTLPYIHRAFPSADLMSLAIQMNASQKAGELGTWMLNFIRENKDFSVPPLDEPVDFTQPVMFCVIAGRGNYSLYTVTVVEERQDVPSEPDAPPPSKPDEPGIPDEPAVPPAKECEKRILSFVVNEPKQTKPSVITDGAGGGTGAVTFTLSAGADASALYPVITVSEGAGILPLTQEYLLRLFTYTELISFYAGYSTATDINAFVSAAVKRLDADKAAAIMESDFSLPIDFSGFNSILGVPFAVVGADKTVRVYMASACADEDTAALTAFAVTKIRNPGLMGDADVSVQGGTVTITATYPVEYQNFKLIPDIVIEGDTWEITGGTLRAEAAGTSEEEAEYAAGLEKAVYLVPSDAYPVGNEYTATLTVRRGQAAAEYTLRLAYKEDPDTIRSITDFRFLKLRNPGIRATSMASISKNEDTGFISAAVMYEGDEPPYDLVADFYSPGTCTVEHVEQASGKSRNSYQYDVQILCTSKNKLFCRLYTVHVTFIKVKSAEAVLTYFSFPKHLNPDLSQSAAGLVDEASGTVYVNAKYHSPAQPSALVPEFAATGSVFVSGILQSSGYSAQDFSHSVYYSVRAQNDWSSDSRTYRISVSWERDEQSACAITSFGFSASDNPSLEKDVSARITERTGAIYALLPKDAGRSALVPRFSAQGTVTVDGAEQASGSSRQDFSGEVVYTVTSANGLYSKQYAVSVQEAGPVIYVDAAAIGRNNGTCWQDAYITLDAAFEQAQAYGDSQKEIWIAHNGGEAYAPLSDAYRASGLPLTANTIIRGGFDGTEARADDRRKKQRKIEFDVNAVENAKGDETNIIHNSSDEADVCAVQTKLYQPGATANHHLFKLHDDNTNTPSREIVFDGIDMELNSHSASLLGHDNITDVSLTLSDCTVRAASIGASGNYYFNTVLVENSKLAISSLYAETVGASCSDFVNPPYSDLDSRLSIKTKDKESLILKYCTFSNADSSKQTELILGEKITVQIDSCSFDNMSFPNTTSSYSAPNLYFKKCRYSFSANNSNTNLYANEITDCELKNESAANNALITLRTQCDITGSTIEGFKLTLGTNEYCNLHVENSTFNNSSFNTTDTNDYVQVEMLNTKMKETGDSLFNVNSCPSFTVSLDNCAFSNSAVSDCSKSYIIVNSYNNPFINIDSCTFNIENNFLEMNPNNANGGNLTIQNSQCIYPSKRNAKAITIINANGTIKLTGNTFKSKSQTFFYCNLASNYRFPENSTTFTENKIESPYTNLYAIQLNTFGGNQYDNFVRYYVSPLKEGDIIDFSAEQIEIEKPLYNKDLKEISKKAAIILNYGEIRIDDEKNDFLCCLSLLDSTASVSGQQFSLGDYPSFEDVNKSYPVSGSFSYPVKSTNGTLELTSCTIDGDLNTYKSIININDSHVKDIKDSSSSITAENNSEIGNITSSKTVVVSSGSTTGDIQSGTVAVSSGSTTGDIQNATSVTGTNSTINGSITNNESKCEINLTNTSVAGYLMTTGDSDITMTAYSGTNISIMGYTSDDLKRSIASISKGSGTLQLTNITILGYIYWNGTVNITGSEIKEDIGGFNNLTAENSTFEEDINGTTSSTIKLQGVTADYVSTSNSLTIESYNENERNSVICFISGMGEITITDATVDFLNITGDSSVTITNSTFSLADNSTITNNAIDIRENNNTTLTITHSSFSNYLRAPINFCGKELTITDSCFKNNGTTSAGGASGGAAINVENETAGKIDIRNSRFINNTSKLVGGAIFIECKSDNIVATINNCEFESNTTEINPSGCDVYMKADRSDGSSYSGCKLKIDGCTTDNPSNSVYLHNVDLYGSYPTKP
ncbi:MAG: hypothetical protein K2H09_07985 [Treponemataceae bacterium]|nr:hypothetical protein [Treponemataceae bacterium]